MHDHEDPFGSDFEEEYRELIAQQEDKLTWEERVMRLLEWASIVEGPCKACRSKVYVVVTNDGQLQLRDLMGLHRCSGWPPVARVG